MTRFWRAIGIDRIKDESYVLCFTSDIQSCKQYYIDNGWNEDDLIFEPQESDDEE